MNSSLNTEGGQYVRVRVCVSVGVCVLFLGWGGVCCSKARKTHDLLKRDWPWVLLLYCESKWNKKFISEATTLKKQSCGIKIWLLRTCWAFIAFRKLLLLPIRNQRGLIQSASLFTVLLVLLVFEPFGWMWTDDLKASETRYGGNSCFHLLLLSAVEKIYHYGQVTNGGQIFTCVMSLFFHIQSHTSVLFCFVHFTLIRISSALTLLLKCSHLSLNSPDISVVTH